VLTDYDWAGAEKEFERALELNPSDASTHELYAMWLLTPLGREKKALAEISLAVNSDPHSLLGHFHHGWILFEFGRYAEAKKAFERTYEIDSNFVFSHLTLGLVYAMQKEYEAAIRETDTPAYRAGGHSRQLTTLAYVLAVAGEKKRLEPLLAEIEARMSESYVPPFNVARVFAALGQTDRAFRLLQQAYDERDPGLIYLQVDPTAVIFQNDARFDALLRQMRLKN
jgi:tetratricopeptide (TPR) repeat protein